MITRRLYQIAIFAILPMLLIHAADAESGLPAAARVLDPDVNTSLRPYPTISPDGKWVAYVAYGFVCVCNIAEPEPRKIIEVPNSWTWSHFTVPHGKSLSDPSYGILAKDLTQEQHDRLLSEVTKTIAGFNWTHDSSGFVFCIQSADKARNVSTYDTYLAAVDGKLTDLIHVDSNAKTRTVSYGTLTRDRHYLVSEQGGGWFDDYRPLIWSLGDKKPRATPFKHLIPSAKSGRWLGIEKDSGQLVIADENFDVIKRFEEYQQGRTYGLKLDWSPDERFIIWRNQIGFDHYNDWEGFWLNLDTCEKRPLEGQFMDEQIEFTGRGGEYFRCGADGVPLKHMSGTQYTGAHFTIAPEDKSQPLDIWRLTSDPKDSKSVNMINQYGYPSAHMSSDTQLFVIRIPRKSTEKPGLEWNLIDRDGHRWRLPGKESDEYVSPYEVVGFAEDGKLIIAYDNKQLFAVPTESVMVSSNKVP